MRHCPVCWMHRKLSTVYHEVRYWWLYSVLKKPKPDPVKALMELTPALVSTFVGLRIIDELIRNLDDEYRKIREKDDATDLEEVVS